MNPLRALQKWWSRRVARRLLGQHLPRGLPEPRLPFALRVPPALPPEGEFWTLLLGAQLVRGRAPSLLLRLSALPPAPRRLEVLRPSTLRLDGDLRLPTEVDPLRLASDAPSPARERKMRPRTPLARAPLHRLEPRNFRLDPHTAHPANEGILPLERRDSTYRWVRPAFRREKLDLPWMARDRIRFLGPTQPEWFQMWWDETQAHRPGGSEPRAYDLPYELELALEQVKEQMLIRRDVKKDESPPEPQEFYYLEMGHPISALDTPPVTQLVPEKQWVVPAGMPPPLRFGRAAREAYLQWRTLVNALEER